MRIHLGHHFYGAGNLGDDFMLAGFLAAMRSLEPAASFTCSVPFALAPLRRRFPAIEWLAYDDEARRRAIDACDVWLGLGGSPFQSAQSRWFIDHLTSEAARCEQAGKPMFFLGVGVQEAAEIEDPAVRRLCEQATGIWTRDTASAARLRAREKTTPIWAAADLAHVFFQDHAPSPVTAGRLTLVANFDYGTWPGQAACLRAADNLHSRDRVWLAQETRELPGAERALYAALPPVEQSRWRLVSPDEGGAPLGRVLERWPSGEWLITARYHAALAGAWSGSKVVVIGTNEKLRAAAAELAAPLIMPDAHQTTVERALQGATPIAPPRHKADEAYAACASFLRSAVAQRR